MVQYFALRTIPVQAAAGTECSGPSTSANWGCGYTLYGWESSPPQDEGETGRTVHYLYEPGSFVPVVQELRKTPIRLLRQPDWSGRKYDFDQDPLWHTEVKAQPFEAIAWYQCDHLGTTMELTNHTGEVAWTAQYKAGVKYARRVRSGPGRLG